MPIKLEFEINKLSCNTGKVGYESPYVATRAMKALKREGHNVIRYYQCKGCDNWHLTSKDFNPSMTKTFRQHSN